jgi:hypothetical protein
MGIMKRYRMFPYEIKQTPEGKYYGIVYTIAGTSISGKTDEFIVEHDAKVEAFKVIDEKRDALDQPPNRKENG